MPAIEVGRICTKVTGREQGKRCVVVDIIDKNFILVTGPESLTGVKRRRVNINHIQPTGERLKLKRGASDEEVSEALGKAGKVEASSEAESES